MKKASALLIIFIIAIFAIPFPLYTQEESDSDTEDIQDEDIQDNEIQDDEIQIETDWQGELPPLYSLGDKTFNISLGLIFPTLFFQNGERMESNMSKVGGAGSLAFNYFLNSHFFAGAEIGGQFNSTIGKNTLFIIPIGLRAGYQFLIWKMEIPVSMVIGIAPHTYISLGYAGFFIKGGVSAYYRFNPDWSFGMDFSWAWFPEWIKNEPAKNADGNYINLVLSARYHF